MQAAFPPSDYYGASAPPGGHQLAPCLPAPGMEGQGDGRPRTVPTFTICRSTGEAPSFTPAASPTATPWSFTVAPVPGDAIRTRARTPYHLLRPPAAHRPVSTRF